MNGVQDSNNPCRICGHAPNPQQYSVREHMFGLEESFSYFLCANCGCLQIKEIPMDLSKYYPDNYYSKMETSQASALRKEMTKLRDGFYINGRGKIGRFLSTRYPDRTMELLAKLMSKGADTKIVDVGCGYGDLIRRLHSVGFNHLSGIDPYVAEEIHADGLDISRRTIDELKEEFDLVMFHHSLEHMADPESILKKAKDLISDEGRILIRVPTVSSYAWDHYKENWIQIDAPRHIHLFSITSLKILAERAGLEIISRSYDSNGFQFWGSEQNLKGIPLRSAASYANKSKSSMFNKNQISEFEMRALELNRTEQGDQVAVVMGLPLKRLGGTSL